jgi:hypothetical protein
MRAMAFACFLIVGCGGSVSSTGTQSSDGGRAMTGDASGAGDDANSADDAGGVGGDDCAVDLNNGTVPLSIVLQGVDMRPDNQPIYVGAVHVYAGTAPVSRATAAPSQTVCGYVPPWPNCNYSFPKGTVVTLIAVDGDGAIAGDPQPNSAPSYASWVPSNGSAFMGWDGCTLTPEDGVCVFIVPDQAPDPCLGPPTVTGTFEAVPNFPLMYTGAFDLNVTVNSPLSLKIPAETANPLNATQTLHLDSDDGIQFEHWYWFRRGATVTLEPVALPGLAFQQWDGCADVTSGNACVVTFDGTGPTAPFAHAIVGFSEFWDCGFGVSHRVNTGNCTCHTYGLTGMPCK